MPVQKRLSLAGLSKQTAKGTAATAATYGFGVLGGQVARAEVSEDDLNVSYSSRILEAHDRISVVPGAAFETVAMPRMLGLLLFGACGSVTTTGAAAPYTHTIKAGDDLPYLTAFARAGASYYKLADAKVDEVELSFDRTGALRVSSSLVACGLSFEASAYTVTTEERPNAAVLKGVGGTFQIDGANANIKAGSVKVSNSIEPIVLASAVTPADVFPGMISVEVSLTVVPDDYNLFRQVITGTSSGTTVQSSPEFGTATVKWVADANTDLTLTVNRMKFAVDFPEVDPAGGAQELTLEGVISQPTSGDAFTFALRNAVSAY